MSALLGSAPEPGRTAPFLTRCRLGMGTNDRTVDHQILTIAVAGEQGENAPHTLAGDRPHGDLFPDWPITLNGQADSR